MKSKLGYFIDNVFTIFVVFLVTFVWVRHFIHNTILLFLVTFLISLVVSFFLILFFDKNNTKIKNNAMNNSKIENLKNSLLFFSQNQILDFFQKNLPVETKIDNDYLVVNIQSKDIIFVPFIKVSNISIQDYVDIFKRYQHFENDIIVIGINEDNNCSTFRSNLNKNIKFFSINQFYFKFLLDKEIPVPPFKVTKKRKFLELLAIFFNKKQTKKYFFLTLFFCVYAFLFRYSIYYLICGLILAIMTIYSLKNKRFNIKEEKTLFESV